MILERNAAEPLPSLLIAALLVVAFAFGGGGIGTALANLMVQLTALAVLASQRRGFGQFWRESPLTLRVLIGASLLLPLIQIVPLPESVWTALPGRELVARSFDLVGGDGWATYSVDPRRTLLALTALITPLAVLFAGWSLPRERLLDLGWLVVVLGLVTILLGAFQFGAPSGDAAINGAQAANNKLLGTFANRNSTGLFLTFALGLAALLPAPRPHPAVLPARIAVCALLLLAVFLTLSRTAIVLALLPVTLGLIRGLIGLMPQGDKRSAGRIAMVGMGAIALVGLGTAGLIALAPGRVSDALERFEAKDDPRRFIWEDATFSAGRYWPAGSGVGTFDEIYQVDESLENLTARRAGRVHNDYIELAIEAGAFGLALAAMWAVLIAWLSWRARDKPLRWAAWSGSAFLLAIALQSITDYPLRNQTILALAGFALLLLTRIAVTDRSAKP